MYFQKVSFFIPFLKTFFGQSQPLPTFKLVSFLWLILIFFPVSGLMAAPPALQVSGNKLQTSGGCAKLLKGVNVDGLEFSSTGEGPTGGNGGNTLQVAQMAVTGWGCNIIRLPLNQDYWFGCNGANQANYQSIISGIVSYCSGQNVYVILDLHWSGNGNWGSATTPSRPATCP